MSIIFAELNLASFPNKFSNFSALIFNSFGCESIISNNGSNDAEFVDSLIKEMTIDEKIGQMTQVDQQFLNDISDISKYGFGSLLSGGGSTPKVNEPKAWADMYDQYQREALNSRLKIPLLYGIDAVHGHNNVVQSPVQYSTRDTQISHHIFY